MRALLFAAAATVAATGCTEDRLTRLPNARERAAATGVAEQVASLARLSAVPNEVATLTRAVDATHVVALLAPAGIPMVLPSRTVKTGLADCVADTQRTATYRNCELGEHVIEGSTVRADGSAHAGLSDVLIVGPSLHGATNVDARLDAGSTTSGIVEVDVMWTVDNDEFTLDATLTVDGLRRGTGDCPVAGSIAVAGTLRRGGVVLRTQARTLSFGPACGDLHVSP